jgi:hypothetical protein
LGRGCTEGRTESFYECDPEVGTHTCTPAHQIDTHGCTGKRVKGAHYMHAYWLHSCACVCGCALDMHALEHACKLSRRAHMRAGRMDRHA